MEENEQSNKQDLVQQISSSLQNPHNLAYSQNLKIQEILKERNASINQMQNVKLRNNSDNTYSKNGFLFKSQAKSIFLNEQLNNSVLELHSRSILNQLSGDMVNTSITQRQLDEVANQYKKNILMPDKQMSISVRHVELESQHSSILKQIRTIEKLKRLSRHIPNHVSRQIENDEIIETQYNEKQQNGSMKGDDDVIQLATDNDMSQTFKFVQDIKQKHDPKFFSVIREEHESQVDLIKSMINNYCFSKVLCESCSLFIQTQIECIQLECLCYYHVKCIEKYLKRATMQKTMDCPNKVFGKCQKEVAEISENKLREIQERMQQLKHFQPSLNLMDSGTSEALNTVILKCMKCFENIEQQMDAVILSCKCIFHIRCIWNYVVVETKMKNQSEIPCPGLENEICLGNNKQIINQEEMKFILSQNVMKNNLLSQSATSSQVEILVNLKKFDEKEPPCKICCKTITDLNLLIKLKCECTFHVKCAYLTLFKDDKQVHEVCPTILKKNEVLCNKPQEFIDEREIVQIVDKYEETKEKKCPFCQYRRGFLLFDTPTCRMLICNKCFNEWIQIIYERQREEKIKFCYNFFNCQSVATLINEKHYEKAKLCNDSHNFNYFKIRAFLEHVIYVDEIYRIFIYDQMWPNKCEEHYETIAAKVAYRQIKCMQCYTEFELRTYGGNSDDDSKGIKKKKSKNPTYEQQQSFCGRNCKIF